MVLGFTLIACAAEPEVNLTLPAPDRAMFETEVYPVLLRDCGFPECHGSPDRFFQVVGPGRTRLLGEETALFADATAEELSFSYDRARSMLAYESSIDEALLLRKPLAVIAGGGGHKGLDEWDGDVYLYTGDPGYTTLRRWAFTGAGGGSGNLNGGGNVNQTGGTGQTGGGAIQAGTP